MLQNKLLLIGTVCLCVPVSNLVTAQPSAAEQAEAVEQAEAAARRELDAALAQQVNAERERAASAEEAARAVQLQDEFAAARRQLDRARAELEEAARRIAARPAPMTVDRNALTIVGDRFSPRAQIGVTVVDAREGALVTQLRPGGGAADAGLEIGDVILSVDGAGLVDGESGPAASLRERLDAVEPGEVVRLAIERGGAMLDLSVETRSGTVSFGDLPELPDFPLAVFGDEGRDVNRLRTPSPAGTRVETIGPNVEIFRALNFTRSPWGDMELIAMTEALGRYFGTSEGLLVVNAPGDEATGLEGGDVILEISGRSPNSPEHAIRILGSFEPEETIEFTIMRNGTRQTIEYLVPGTN